MSTRKAAGLVALLWLVGVGTMRAHAQGTVDFAPGNPVWTGAPNRYVSTTMNYTSNAGFTVHRLDFQVYKVTFVNGVRNETLVAAANSQAPPPIPPNGASNYGNTLAAGGTNCVKISVTHKDAMNQLQAPITKQSPDKNL